MNIFVTDYNPIKAAENLCDKHCNKMFLESCQMLANCFSLEDLKNAPKTQKGTVRKHSYWNHPCSIWTRETYLNFMWLVQHTTEILNQRNIRGYKPHFTEAFFWWVVDNKEKIQLNNKSSRSLTDFAIAINKDQACRQIKGFDNFSPLIKYRLYYKLDKQFAVWKLNRPEWIDWDIKTIINN